MSPATLTQSVSGQKEQYLHKQFCLSITQQYIKYYTLCHVTLYHTGATNLPRSSALPLSVFTQVPYLEHRNSSCRTSSSEVACHLYALVTGTSCHSLPVIVVRYIVYQIFVIGWY